MDVRPGAATGAPVGGWDKSKDVRPRCHIALLLGEKSLLHRAELELCRYIAACWVRHSLLA